MMLDLFDRPSRYAAWGPTVLRAIGGFIFLMYGWDKFFGLGQEVWSGLFAAQGIPLPNLAAILVGVVEIGAGLALIVGLFTRWAALLLAIDMAVATLVVGLDGGFWVWDNGVSFPLALFAAVASLTLMGPGAAALDDRIGSRTPDVRRESPVASRQS